jgi:hypothetical protein
LSTTIGWPQAALSFGVTMRASRSAEPPGRNVTTTRIGFDGYCAQADAVAMAIAASRQAFQIRPAVALIMRFSSLARFGVSINCDSQINSLDCPRPPGNP